MTFIELCELTYEFTNRVPTQFESVNLGRGSDGTYEVSDPDKRRVIRAVKDAYRQIVNLSAHWDWLHRRAKLFEIQPDVERYESLGLADLWDRSMYVVRPGEENRFPLEAGDYRDWLVYDRIGVRSRGQPLKVYETPNGDILVWPVPTETWEVWGDETERAPTLELAIDEPLWDEDLHDVVADVAVQRLNMQLDSSEELVQRLNVADARIRASTKIREMLRRGTPEIEL